MITEDEVYRMFRQGFDCSQIVLLNASERLGMTRDDALKVASCFGNGIFRGSVCGAALGALMALGLRYGNSVEDDMATKLSVLGKRDEYLRRFEEMNGSSMCPVLLGREIRSMAETVSASEQGIYEKCPKYCVNAVKIMDDML